MNYTEWMLDIKDTAKQVAENKHSLEWGIFSLLSIIAMLMCQAIFKNKEIQDEIP